MVFYDLICRANLVKNPFVADKWNLRGFNNQPFSEGERILNETFNNYPEIPAIEREFCKGEKILNWPDDVWFGASTAEFDGDVDDFVVNNAMAPVVTMRFLELLKILRTPHFQELPVNLIWSNGKRESAWVLNFTELVSCLDVEKTDVDYFPQTWSNPLLRGKIWTIRNTTLIGKNVDGYDLFRCAEYPGHLFGSENFKRFFEEKKMTGVSFQKIKLS